MFGWILKTNWNIDSVMASYARKKAHSEAPSREKLAAESKAISGVFFV